MILVLAVAGKSLRSVAGSSQTYNLCILINGHQYGKCIVALCCSGTGGSTEEQSYNEVKGLGDSPPF
jgi:hypothetical protein